MLLKSICIFYRMENLQLKDPVREGFFGGLGFLASVLLVALIFVVCYIFYLTFLV
jgi:hypothetical protein